MTVARFLSVVSALLLVLGHAPSAVAKPPQLGDQASDFTLRDIAGQEVRLSSFRGRPVLLTFWATWCEPCKVEMPEIQKAYDQHKANGFVVLAVNFGEKAEKAKAHAEQHGMSFPVLVDRRANVASQYTVVSLPVSLFIDAGGVIRERVFGGTLTVKRIEEILQRLTATGSP